MIAEGSIEDKEEARTLANILLARRSEAKTATIEKSLEERSTLELESDMSGSSEVNGEIAELEHDVSGSFETDVDTSEQAKGWYFDRGLEELG